MLLSKDFTSWVYKLKKHRSTELLRSRRHPSAYRNLDSKRKRQNIMITGGSLPYSHIFLALGVVAGKESTRIYDVLTLQALRKGTRAKLQGRDQTPAQSTTNRCTNKPTWAGLLLTGPLLCTCDRERSRLFFRFSRSRSGSRSLIQQNNILILQLDADQRPTHESTSPLSLPCTTA